MIRLLVLCAVFSAALVSRAAESDDQTRARKAATDVAGAFTNDGFKTRDGFWSGPVRPGQPAIVAVNLYAGNQYWFSAGANEQAKKIAVTVFDETGHQVVSEPYSAGEKAAAGFSPTNSGQFYVSIAITEGEPAVCCLIYSYK